MPIDWTDVLRQAEFEAILARLERSCWTFALGVHLP
jgi:hypothetical protein